MALKHLEPLNEDWSKGMERYKVALKDGKEIDVKVKEGEGLAKVEQLLKEEELEYHQITKKASRPTLTEKKPGPDGYMTGLSDEDEEDKKDQMKKQAAMDDDDPDAYKEMPGDEEAREEGRVKKSKHTRAYHKKFGENMQRLKTIDQFLNENFDFTNEGFTSKLNVIRQKAKDAKDFIKKTLADKEFSMFNNSDKFKMFLTDFYGVATESVVEAYIGPFVFNDKMSDEELKDMYDAALDGYANYSRGFQHPKSKYKQAYQEIEKILKKRGVSVDEGTLYGNEVAIYMGEDGETRIEKRGRGYYGYNDEFDFTAKNKRELEQKLSGWGYYLIAGSLDEAVELVHVYKDGELYGTGELVKGKDKKIKGKKHQLIRFDGSTEDYYPAEDVKLVESVNEKRAPFPYNLGYNGRNNYWKYAEEIGMAVKDIEGIRDYHKMAARGGKTAVQDLNNRILITTIGQPEIKDAIIKALKGVDDNIDLKTIKSNYDAPDRERSKHEQDNDMWKWEIQKYEDFHSYKRKYGDAPKQDREFTRDHQMKFIDMLAPYSTTQHQLADIEITSLDSFLQYAADHVSSADLKKVTKRIKKEYPKLESVQTSNDIEAIAESVSEGAKLDVSRYKRVWGKEPKGFGQWLFSFDPKGDQDKVFDVGNAMNYSDAKKLALRVADKNGERTVYLMESVNEELRPDELEHLAKEIANHKQWDNWEPTDKEVMNAIKKDKPFGKPLLQYATAKQKKEAVKIIQDHLAESVNEDRNTKYTRELTKIFRKEFEEFPFGYYQDGKDYQANKRIIIEPEGFNPDGTLFDMKDDWREDIIRAVRKHKKKWSIAPNMGGGLTIHIKESVNEKKSWTLVRPGKGYVRKMTSNDYVKDIKHGVKFKTIKSAEQGAEYFNRFHRIDDVVVQAVDEAVNEKKQLPKEITKHKDIPSWARYVAQHSDGEWTWYEETPTMIRFKSGGGAWKQDGNQIYTGVKTDGKDWDKMPTYYYVKNGKITESADEKEQTNLRNLQTLESFISEKKDQTNDQSPLGDDGMETGIKNKAKESGVPVGLLRIIMRRGLAAWKTGHRPGATQAQWGYARVNSFLTKQKGTWGGADADIAKKVRDGGHDKKL